jgi:hypothetical protein
LIQIKQKIQSQALERRKSPHNLGQDKCLYFISIGHILMHLGALYMYPIEVCIQLLLSTHQPPAFGSSANLEALAQEADGSSDTVHHLNQYVLIIIMYCNS